MSEAFKSPSWVIAINTLNLFSATISHRRQCYWCEGCDTFRTNKTDHNKHCPALKSPEEGKRKLPVIACPECKKKICRYALLTHISNLHKDVDPDKYRSRAKTGYTQAEKDRNRRKFLKKLKEVMRNSEMCA